MDRTGKFEFRGEETEPEASREARAFRQMVESAGGLEKVAASVLEHTGVGKQWVYDWFNLDKSPPEAVKRQIFVELRHLSKESPAQPQTEAQRQNPAKPIAGPLRPPIAKPAASPAKPGKKPKIRAGIRERFKAVQEARWMKDEEYAELHKKLVERGLISPVENQDKKE